MSDEATVRTPRKPLPTKTPREYYSKAEAAEYLGVSQRTINRRIEEGVLEAVKLKASANGAIRISRAAMDKFLRGAAA